MGNSWGTQGTQTTHLGELSGELRKHPPRNRRTKGIFGEVPMRASQSSKVKTRWWCPEGGQVRPTESGALHPLFGVLDVVRDLRASCNHSHFLSCVGMPCIWWGGRYISMMNYNDYDIVMTIYLKTSSLVAFSYVLIVIS